MAIRLFSFFILMSMFSFAKAQNTEVSENDISSWTSLKIQKKINKNLSMYITPEVRTFNDGIDKYLGDIGVKYEVFKWLDAALTYRYAQESKKKGGFKSAHRFAADLKSSGKFGDVEPTLRLRYTNKYDVKDLENTENLRLKGSIDYDISKVRIKPFIQSEIFYKITDTEWNKYRLGAGASLKLNKANYIEVVYILQKDLDNIDNEHIISLGYKIKL